MSIRSFLNRTKEFEGSHMFKLLAVILLLMLISGCAEIPIKDGGLVVGKDTTASIEDLGVASLNSRF